MSVLAETGGSRGDVAVIAPVASAHFSSHFLMLSLPPLFPILNAEFGVTFTQLGLAMTLFSVASGLGQMTAGVLVDRYGAHRLLVLGITAMASAIALAGFATHYWMLLPLMLLAGVGNSVFHPADLSILSHRIAGQRLGRAYAAHGLAGSLGFATAPMLVTSIAAATSWRVALVTAGLIGLAIAAFVLLSRSALLYEVRPAAPRAAGERQLGLSYLGLIGSPVVMLAFGYFALTAFAGAGVQTFASTALTEGYGLNLHLATLGLTAYLVGSACGVAAGGFLADRTERHDRVAMVGMGAVAILMVIVAASPGLGLGIIALLFVAGLAGGVTAPSRDVLIRRAAATLGRGTGSVFGFVYSGFDLGASTAPLLFGILVDHHAAQAVFLAIAAIYALAAPTVMQVRSRTARGRPAPAE